MKLGHWSKHKEQFVAVIDGAADNGDIAELTSAKGVKSQVVLVERVASLWTIERVKDSK